MVLVRRGDRGNIDDVWRQMERFIDHISTTRRPLAVFTHPAWQPMIDVYENPEQVVVLVELAGVVREELQISVDGEYLTLRGSRKDALRGRKQRCYVLEISFGPFERVVPLPARVDSEQASAIYSDGFLEIVLPKARELRTHKVILSPH